MSENNFSNNTSEIVVDQLRQYTLITYILYALSVFIGLTSIAAIVMNYIKRGEVKGTWLESHFDWQIKTFWVSFVVAIIGWILSFVLIGIPILLAIAIWYIYRIVKGMIFFFDRKPIGQGWF